MTTQQVFICTCQNKQVQFNFPRKRNSGASLFVFVSGCLLAPSSSTNQPSRNITMSSSNRSKVNTLCMYCIFIIQLFFGRSTKRNITKFTNKSFHLAKLLYFTKLEFPEIAGDFPKPQLPKLRFLVVWGSYNLTSFHGSLETTKKHPEMSPLELRTPPFARLPPRDFAPSIWSPGKKRRNKNFRHSWTEITFFGANIFGVEKGRWLRKMKNLQRFFNTEDEFGWFLLISGEQNELQEFVMIVKYQMQYTRAIINMEKNNNFDNVYEEKWPAMLL